MKAPRGYWTCRVCHNPFPRPDNYHQRTCDACLAQTTVCQCSDSCGKVIQKYRLSGKERLYAIGHSPQERAARSRNGRKVWDKPGFREKSRRVARETNKRRMEDESYVESLRERMRRQSLEWWQDPEYRRMHREMKRDKAKGVRTWKTKNSQAQAELMRRMSLEWWSDPEVRKAKLACLRRPRPSISRENNPNWRGGRSFEPYSTEFTEELKAKIRARDGHACFICGLREEDHHRSLAVHHIDYDKENCDPANLVTLCDTCHGKTSHRRKYWMNRLQRELQARLDEIEADCDAKEESQ